MIVIGDASNKALSEGLAKQLNAQVFYPDIHIFPDGEQRVRLLEEVVGEDAVVVKSFVGNIDQQVLQFCFVIDALKRNGASSITGVVPYLPYCRADHMFRTGEAVPLEVVIRMLEHSGLTRIILVDPHSIKTPEMFKIPVIDLSALELFAEKIKEIEPDSSAYTLVTPDMGGIRRIKILSELLGGVEYSAIEKDRDLETGNLQVAKIHGEHKKTVFIVDDMISSGGTIVQAVKTLKERGAEKQYVMATHAVLSDQAPKILQDCEAEKIIVTDVLPVSDSKNFSKLEVLSVASLVATSLKDS